MARASPGRKLPRRVFPGRGGESLHASHASELYSPGVRPSWLKVEENMKHSAVLLIDCPDRKGLVARVSSLLYERGANILHADQHQDHALGLFFMRV